jgi:hypothetical protein
MIALLSVVLLEVDPIGIAILEFEGDASRSVHMHRVSDRSMAAQGMKVETGNVHVLRLCSPIEGIQPPQDSAAQPGVYLLRRAVLPERGQSLASKASDHG